ncbi:MAG: hypothetical protein WD672_08370 [Woeseia sp.]
MHRSSQGPAHKVAVAGALLAMALGGCAQVEDWLRNTGHEPDEYVEAGVPDADRYLVAMQKLASGDPAAQAEVYADANAAATLTPGPSTRLQLALVLGIPGHPESNPGVAQDMLRELLAESALLTPTEQSLAMIHLHGIEEQVKLARVAEQLQGDNHRAVSSEQAAITQRLAVVEAENRQLQQALDEANQKLEAITTIERSIRERTDDNNN